MPKQKCKICGKNTDGGEFCFVHKRRKALPSFSTSRNEKDRLILEEHQDMRKFFLSIWKKKLHRCENCNRSLGKEPLSYMFDHVLEKSKYPKLAFEEENIMLLCLDCHDNKTRGLLSNTMKDRQLEVKSKFSIL